jgi:hypothetical protein
MGAGGMMARRSVLGMLAAGAAAVLAGCNTKTENMGFLWQTPYHARLTAEIETPEGVRSGSSVIEVKWDKANRGFHVTGEAVAVDLPDGQTLFVLLRSAASPDWTAYLHESVKLDSPTATSEEFYRKIAADRRVWPVNRRRKTAIEDSDNYPYLVRFRDQVDPKSVEQVDPDNLAKSFGPGYHLKSLTVQMTDAPVTIGIEKQLEWWNAFRNRHFDGTSTVSEDMTSHDLSSHLSSGSFSTEFNK